MSPRPEVRLVLLPRAAVAALVDGDLARAGAASGLALPPEFLDRPSLWRLRLDQVDADPASAPWLVHATVRVADGTVVGHAGFHGPPDAHGMVEVGYSVVAAYRGQGLAHATLAALLHVAAEEPAVRVVRASVAPGNVASLAVVRAAGFVVVGEQVDERDGPELVLERPIDAPGEGMHD